MINFSVPNYFTHGRDQRSKETIQVQKTQIQNLCLQNNDLFKNLVELEMKREVAKFKNEILNIELSGGRYLSYTDRVSYLNGSNKNIQDLPVIMTVHGVPGSPNDFLSLQQNTQARLSCRWINFLIPGLDNKDERRENQYIYKHFINQGTYQGYLKDISLLMHDFLDQIQIQKVILVMHSAGGMFAKNFAIDFPWKVKAMVSLASAGIGMYLIIFLKYE